MPDALPPPAAIRVLVVDDDPLNRELAIFNLAAAGLTVTTAHSGEQAIEMIRADPPDVILSDFNMARMSGLELNAALQADARLAGIPFLLISAAPPPEWRRALESDPIFCVRSADFREAIAAIRAAVRPRA